MAYDNPSHIRSKGLLIYKLLNTGKLGCPGDSGEWEIEDRQILDIKDASPYDKLLHKDALIAENRILGTYALAMRHSTTSLGREPFPTDKNQFIHAFFFCMFKSKEIQALVRSISINFDEWWNHFKEFMAQYITNSSTQLDAWEFFVAGLLDLLRATRKLIMPHLTLDSKDGVS